MRISLPLAVVLILSVPGSASPSGLSLSTYLGGTDADVFADMAVDSAGNICVVGTTTPLAGDFPTFNWLSLCAKPNRGGSDNRKTDAFLTIFSPEGARLSSTYLGGSADDYGAAVAAGNGSLYAAGTTGGASSDTTGTQFPTTAGAYKTEGNGVFVVRVGPSHQEILSSTLIEGTDVTDMALDAGGCPIVVGYWNGGPFTPTADAFQKTPRGTWDGTIVKLDPGLTRVEYASFLGGGNTDQIEGVAVGPDGTIYVAGYTHSHDFPATPGAFQPDYPAGSTGNGFVARFSASCAFEGATFLGAWSLDGLKANASSLHSVAVDSSGDVHVAGTYTRNGIDGGSQQSEAFAAKLSPYLGSLLYYKPLYGINGANGYSSATSIAVDRNGCAHVGGVTDYDDFPAVNQYQGYRAGGQDAFLTKLSPDGEFITCSTYLGGSAWDAAPAVAVDTDGNAVVAGKTRSSDFPVSSSPFQEKFGGEEDAFVSTLVTTPASAVNGANLGLRLSSPRLRAGDRLSMSIHLGNDITTPFDAYMGVEETSSRRIASILLNGYVDDGIFPCARGVQGLKGDVLLSVWRNMVVTPGLAGQWTLYIVTTDPGRLPEGVGSIEDLKEFEKLGKLPKFAQTIYTIDCVLSASGVR